MSPLELIAALVLGGTGGYGLAALLRQRRTPPPLAALQAQVVDLSRRYESTAIRVNPLQEELSALQEKVADLSRREMSNHVQINALRPELTEALKSLRVKDVQISALDERQSELDERLTRVVSDTLQLGNEVKGQIEGLEERLEAMAQQQRSMLETLDGQLQGMQSFIVKAAEDAAKQRANLPQQSVVTPVMAQPAAPLQQPRVDDAELQQLLSRQQVLQQQFAQRRRTEGEAAFRTPNGAGL